MKNSVVIFVFLLTLYLQTGLQAQNVGIGTTTPSAKLEVIDSALNRTKVQIRSKTYTDTSTLIFSNKINATTGTDIILSSNQENGFNFSSLSDLPGNTTPNILHLTPQGRIGVNNAAPATSSIVDISSTDKGLLIPRMNSTQKNAIASPADGLMVYDITTQSIWVYKTGIPAGWKELLTNAPGNNTAFMVYLSSDLACNSYCSIPFNGVVFDDGGNFNTTFHRYIASATGVYHFDASVTVNNTSSFYQFVFEKIIGGSPTEMTNSVIRPVSMGFSTNTTLTFTIKLNAGEAVGLAFLSGTTTDTVKGGQLLTWLTGYRIY